MAVRASYESIFRGGKDYAAALVAAWRVRNVDELDRGGASLLGTAGSYGHADVCAWVLDQGGAIDIRGRDDGRTPLLTALWALSGGANQDFILQTVRLLLDRARR
jgi:hypothetical protein